MKKWLEGCVIAFQFLSRLPLPVKTAYDTAAVSRSLPFYPLVGIVIGAIVYAAALLQPAAAAPLNACLLLILWTGLTGGLHLDGWIDTADAFGSHRDRARMLEIMKDSRVGAMGVISAIFLLLLKWASLWTILANGAQLPDFHGTLLYVLLFIPAVSRWRMAAAVVSGPYIGGPKGIGASFAQARKGWIAAAALWLLAIQLLLPSPIWLAVFGSQLIVSWILERAAIRKLGGWTGDLYGALNEAAEAAGLAAAAYLAVVMGG